ncbi:MAG: patatin-like phospholipase family protein [Chthoniobacter sp.]|uniref:patatin-like phospholipase family protein n=1 Tax=Chthoniobacter sp. TaxID=2510640 RepID=UPI0032A3AA51
MSSRVALCLNSSFLGYFAHAGFLRALLALGVRPAAVSGASAGALVAGLFAAGIAPDEMLQLFVSPELRKVFREPGAPWRGFATILNLPGHTGAISGERAAALLREKLGTSRIEDCTAPRLALSVTNLSDARSEAVKSGPLAELILASGAFPGIFASRPVEDRWFWDGGVANALPFDHWIDDPEIDTILLHIVANPQELAVRQGGRPRRMSHAVNLSHQIICDELLRLKTDLARRAGKKLVVLRTLSPRPTLWNPAKVGAGCVEIGAATVEQNRSTLSELAS